MSGVSWGQKTTEDYNYPHTKLLFVIFASEWYGETQRAIATKGLIRDLLCFYELVEHRA